MTFLVFGNLFVPHISKWWLYFLPCNLPHIIKILFFWQTCLHCCIQDPNVFPEFPQSLSDFVENTLPTVSLSTVCCCVLCIGEPELSFTCSTTCPKYKEKIGPQPLVDEAFACDCGSSAEWSAIGLKTWYWEAIPPVINSYVSDKALCIGTHF